MGNVLPNPELGTIEAIIVRKFVGAVTSLNDNAQSNTGSIQSSLRLPKTAGSATNHDLHAAHSLPLAAERVGSDFPG